MNRIIGIVLIIGLLFTQVSCWDVQDVANSAFITGIGLDVSDNPGMLKVTFVMPKPSEVKTRSDLNYTIKETVEAENITRAVEKLRAKISRNVRLGHLQVIVIGEKLSRKNFRGYTDFFTRNPEIALRTRLMFVQGGEAQEIFKVLPVYNRSVVSELVGMVMTGLKSALVRTISFQGVRKELLRNNGTVVASRIILNKNSEEPFIEYKGGAVLKDWRVIGWLNENEVKAANWFFDGANSRVTRKIGGSLYTYLIDSKSTKIIPKTDAGNVGFQVEVEASANIIEKQFGEDLSNPKNIDRLKKILSKVVTDQVTNAVYKSQNQFAVDYLGFGRALEIKNPRLYRKLDWPKVYPNVPVTVKVQTHVHRFGKTT